MSDLNALLKLEVPVVVRVGQRALALGEVIDLVPGSIIELAKNADDELDLLINNKQIGYGQAVKVGENFGIRISYIGDPRERVQAVASTKADDGPSDDELAEALLAGQL